jgi:hypothetical protein
MKARANQMSENNIATVVRLRLPGGTEIEHACQWQTLERFAAYAHELTQCRVLSTDWGPFRFSVSGNEDGVMFEPTSMPDADDFRALLLLMRPFVLQDEQTSFFKVRNILERRLSDHPALRAYLDRQKAIFDGQRCQAMKLVSGDTVINSRQTLELWLNAFQYHRDEKKRAMFEALHGDVLPVELTRALMIEIMLDQARAVVVIGNAIFALRNNIAITPLPGDVS